ncbi:MAG: PASTA domain-containing protein, partial [Candidatus Polarisedimenticolia bacterium]
AAQRGGRTTARERAGGVMPDLSGLSLRRATETLAALGLICRHDTGGPRVTRQAPEPGTAIGPASPCRIVYEGR